MRPIPPKVLKEIECRLFDKYEEDDPSVAHLFRALRAAFKPKRSAAPARKRRQAKKTERQAEWAAIRAQVLKRANEVCEGCGKYGQQGSVHELSVDHFFGGHGRRLTLQSVFTCWALCFGCHHDKTNNKPSPGYWIEMFTQHCKHLAYGVPDDAEIKTGYLHAASIARARLEAIQIQKGATP